MEEHARNWLLYSRVKRRKLYEYGLSPNFIDWDFDPYEGWEVKPDDWRDVSGDF